MDDKNDNNDSSNKSYRDREPDDPDARNRTRSQSPPPWRKEPGRRARGNKGKGKGKGGGGGEDKRRHDRAMKEQTRLNALQEAEQARKWVDQEDTFVLKQAKKKAEIRVKEGRAKPIDWLAVNLRVIDVDNNNRNPLDDEIPDEELDVVDPEGLLDSLAEKDLVELQADIDTYISLETNRVNNDFWRVRSPFCRHDGGTMHDGG